MATDDLNTPLGRNKRQTLPKLPVAGPQLLAGMLGMFGLLVVSWAVFVNDPLGGEPTAAVIVAKPQGASQANSESGDGKQHTRYDGPAAATANPAQAAAATVINATAPPAGSRTITIFDGSSGKSQQVVIPGNASGAEPKGPSGKAPVDPNMLETTRHGAIPKLGNEGARPSVLYARPRALPANRKDAPRIAIVIGGIGISASGTADAFSHLPGPVTFALTPYGVDLEKLAERARGEDHEVLLQVPMEPFDYPDNDPGPQTLLTSLTPDQNIDRLHWLMSRFQGYVGLTGYMGARFTAAEQSLAPVLRESAKRGLVYVDDGASQRSVASQIAGSYNLPFAKTDLVIDAVPTPTGIDRALARLEMLARDNGAAIGLATAQPAIVARIAEWAKKVESRGFVLVPITMVANKAKSS
ncbi:MAG: divergent polysaccharide deacetylase family protein [Rhizobiales bacterium]|nr:divergent polysaccharide deacetylase family protein [Hyphomicrobiales bacterium]